MKREEVKIVYERITERFTVLKEDYSKCIEVRTHNNILSIPTFGYPVDNRKIAQLYNLLMDEDIIEADYTSFAYYLNPTNLIPQYPMKVEWRVTTEPFRLLLRSIFKPFVQSGECTYKELESKCPLMFIDSKRRPLHPYAASSSSTKSPKYYVVKEIIATVFGDVSV